MCVELYLLLNSPLEALDDEETKLYVEIGPVQILLQASLSKSLVLESKLKDGMFSSKSITTVLYYMTKILIIIIEVGRNNRETLGMLS